MFGLFNDGSTELDKPAKALFRHNLTGTMESAIRGSNAQYDNPDVLRRLDVRLMEVAFKMHKFLFLMVDQ
jgi:hypothetical protein